jgi:hypothetical protein
MIVFKKFMNITILLVISLTLHIIPWIPSILLENIVNFMIIFLYIFSAFFVYEIVHIFYHKSTKKSIWKSSFYTILLFCYIGCFAIVQIGISLMKSDYVDTYVFDEQVFYIYRSMELTYKVSVKDANLPIRSLPCASFLYTPITLEKRKNYVYAISEEMHEKIYDLENNKCITHLKN